MNKKIGVGIVVAVVFAGVIYASPYWTVYTMRKAMTNNDAAKFSERVDFPVLRENLKGQFMTQMTEKMAAPDMKDNPFAAFGQTLAIGLVNQMVEALITPNGVMAMLNNMEKKPSSAAQTGKEPTQSPEVPPATVQEKESLKYTLSYENWSTVRARADNADSSEGTVTFKRDGLLGWKLSGIELPAM